MPQIASPTIAFSASVTSTGLNSVFGTLTSSGINANGAIIDAADANSTASVLMKRDSNKRFAGGGFDLLMSQTGVTGLLITGIASQSPGAAYIFVRDSLLTEKFSVNQNGTVKVGGVTVINADGTPATAPHLDGTGAVSGNWAINISGTASGLTTGAVYASLITDYRVATNASAGIVTILAGGDYADSAGNHIPAASQTTASLPTQPTGTNIQYCLISKAPGTGAPVVTAGSAGASPAEPTLPTGNAPLAMVTWRGATTLPTGIVAGADIKDLRWGAGGGGGGTGGTTTDTGVRAAQVVLNGTNAVFPNALDINQIFEANALPNLFLLPAKVKNAAGHAALLDVISSAVTANIVGSIQAGGTTGTIMLAPAQFPLVVSLPGVSMEITVATTCTGTASGSGAGQFNVIADLSGGTSPFVAKLQASSVSLTANQVLLAQVWWDGAAFQLGGLTNATVYFPAYPLLNSSQYKPILIPQQPYAATTLPGDSGAFFHSWPTGASFTVFLPRGGMRGSVTFICKVQQSATAGVGQIGLQIALGATSVSSTAGLTAAEQMLTGTAANGNWATYVVSYESTNLGPGPITFMPGYLNTGVAGNNWTTAAGFMRGEFSL
jgi:hypothetical protein